MRKAGALGHVPLDDADVLFGDVADVPQLPRVDLVAETLDDASKEYFLDRPLPSLAQAVIDIARLGRVGGVSLTPLERAGLLNSTVEVLDPVVHLQVRRLFERNSGSRPASNEPPVLYLHIPVVGGVLQHEKEDRIVGKDHDLAPLGLFG